MSKYLVTFSDGTSVIINEADLVEYKRKDIGIPLILLAIQEAEQLMQKHALGAVRIMLQ